MVEGKEEENMSYLCSLNFRQWVQGVAGGAEDWYWYSSMGLNAPGKRQLSQAGSDLNGSQLFEEMLLYQMEDVEKCWSEEDSCGRLFFFLLGN